MKNSSVLIIIIAFLGSIHAQEISKNALGLRLGDNDGFGGEISYQRHLSHNNRLELDLGWRNSNEIDAIKIAGIYQWVWNIDKGFNWYAGFGGGVGTWSYNSNGYDENGTILFAAGDIGIEYIFDFPMQLSLDMRPELYLDNNDFRDSNFGPDVALGIRYQFN